MLDCDQLGDSRHQARRVLIPSINSEREGGAEASSSSKRGRDGEMTELKGMATWTDPRGHSRLQSFTDECGAR